MLPGATVKPISFVDALFTATSAVCVTGLTIQEIGVYFTGFGKILILILIQIGALGYMSMATLLVILLRRGMNIKGRLLVQQQISETKKIKLSTFIFRVAMFTFSMELIGAIILYFRIRHMFTSELKAAFFGIFHSISAFCNAGFDLFPGNTSLAVLRNDPYIVLLIAILIILGGIGYYVINDVYEYLRSLHTRKLHHITVHTKIVLTTTIFLLLLGTIFYYFTESANPATLKGMPPAQKWLMAFFQSTTPRTAGFSMIDTSSLINSSIIFTIILMFVGASPGGTGGGIKTTTIAVLFANIKAIIAGEDDVFAFKRRIMLTTIQHSVALFSLGVIFIVIATLVISFFESTGLHRIVFEVVSAFGTVGLSTGITPVLSTVSKIMIISTMFFGRVGLLTIGMALVSKGKRTAYRYPEQKIAVG
jgi:trk system potassium uptake protein TrkH